MTPIERVSDAIIKVVIFSAGDSWYVMEGCRSKRFANELDAHGYWRRAQARAAIEALRPFIHDAKIDAALAKEEKGDV